MEQTRNSALKLYDKKINNCVARPELLQYNAKRHEEEHNFSSSHAYILEGHVFIQDGS